MKGYRSRSTPVEIITQSHTSIPSKARPDLSYRIPNIQSTLDMPPGCDVRECNHVLENALSTADRDIYFSPEFTLNDAVVVTMSDQVSMRTQSIMTSRTMSSLSERVSMHGRRTLP